MTYREMLAHIFSRGRFGMKPGLERITVILERLGNPQRRLPAVQIAGTNGKGSTGAFLSAIMTSAGYRTAFFSSPHLVDFRERFRVNDNELPEESVAAAMAQVLAVAPAEATFFEIVTAIAFSCFAGAQAELAIMEAGMGGRWDATNVADGRLSIITPVSLDHCEYLGGTLAAIAVEKAGIIKQDRSVVIATQEPEALAPVLAVAEQLASRVLLAGRDFNAARTADGMSYRSGNRQLAGLKPALQGSFQLGNAAVAITAAGLLQDCGFTVSDAAIGQGVATAKWPGRLELFQGVPPVLLDGAHNPAGAIALKGTLPDFPCRRLILVVGVMADKAWQEVVLALLPLAAAVIAVRPALDRALPAEELADFCRHNGCESSVAGSVAAGLAQARNKAASVDLVLVTGSLFTVGEARAILAGGQFMPIRG